jgi:hypothetical protein
MQHRHAPHTTIKHTRAKILVSALESQVSRGDSNGEGVCHMCKLGYAL